MANPFAFRPAQVTFWTTVVYGALLLALVITNESVPPVRPDGSLFLDRGLNLTEAWLDLDRITQRFHHQNSRENDLVRDYLHLRIEQIIAANDAGSRTTVFNDLTSNVTYLAWGGVVPTHYQGNNLYVYIRGQEDIDGEWWHDARPGKLVGKGGVLVNAHFDSVSTAYGATDDGMGTATVLQMIRYFTTPGNQPRRGIVALLNNAEEPGLLGAAAFGKSPLLPFIHTFLNLEGAGAGGRCVLFRSTDREVTSAFSNVQSPFGSVVGSDGFKLGLVRSGTDYSVWHDIYGQRGLDLAFYRPRALYHTNQDDTQHASRESLWQMMAASTTTLINLSADTGSDYVGDRADGDRSKVPNGSPSDGVWFDLFGNSFVLFGLRGMFAWSLTVLIVGPLTLFGIMYLVHKQGKGYAFHTKLRTTADSGTEDGNYEDAAGEVIPLGGWKGFFRFPFALIVASAPVFGSALLVRKMNPFIIYSSEYAVWTMMMSIFYFAFWLIMRGSSYTRPSALHRLYVHIWLFVLGWAALVFATVLEDRLRIASGYFIVFWESQVFLATLVAVFELFSLPRKSDFGRGAAEEAEVRHNFDAVPQSDAAIAPAFDEAVSPQRAGQSSDTAEDDGDLPDEETPLVRKSGRGRKLDTSFLRRDHRQPAPATAESSNSEAEEEPRKQQPYGGEQAWSATMVHSTWILQFLLLGPFLVILGGQIGLLLTSAVNQTGVDGSSLLAPYLLIAALSVILLMPLSPFMHRVTKHVPLFLLAVALATLIYNLVAFPFSPRAPYKTFFKQTVDLETGATEVHLSGVEGYLRKIIADVPSAAGQDVSCHGSVSRRDLVDCTYDAAQVPPVPTYGSGNKSLDLPSGVPPGPDYYGKLLTISVANTTMVGTGRLRSARIQIDALSTRVVELRFSKEGPPIRSFEVVGADSWDNRFGAFPDDGARLLRLWRRDWESSFVVDITWEGAGGADAGGLHGRAIALWSDANDAANTMPAFREVVRYAPAWAAISKATPGLVEGSKAFRV